MSKVYDAVRVRQSQNWHSIRHKMHMVSYLVKVLKFKSMEKINSDYVTAASYHTLVSINFKDLVDNYSEQTWNSLKSELSSKGTEFVFDDGTNAYFSVDSSDTAYLYIEAAWNEAISNCCSIESDDE